MAVKLGANLCTKQAWAVPAWPSTVTGEPLANVAQMVRGWHVLHSGRRNWCNWDWGQVYLPLYLRVLGLIFCISLLKRNGKKDLLK